MSAMSFGPQTYAAGAATSTSPIDINSDASSSSSRSGRKQVLRVSIPSSTFSIPFDEIGVSPPNDTTTPLSQPITGLNSTGVVPSAVANSHPSSVANTSSSSASASAGRNPTSTTVVPSPSSASFRSTGLAPIRPHSRSSLHKSKSSLEHRPSLSLRGNDARRLEGGITKNRSMTNTSSPRRPSFLSPGLPDALLLSTTSSSGSPAVDFGPRLSPAPAENLQPPLRMSLTEEPEQITVLPPSIPLDSGPEAQSQPPPPPSPRRTPFLQRIGTVFNKPAKTPDPPATGLPDEPDQPQYRSPPRATASAKPPLSPNSERASFLPTFSPINNASGSSTKMGSPPSPTSAPGSHRTSGAGGWFSSKSKPPPLILQSSNLAAMPVPKPSPPSLSPSFPQKNVYGRGTADLGSASSSVTFLAPPSPASPSHPFSAPASISDMSTLSSTSMASSIGPGKSSRIGTPSVLLTTPSEPAQTRSSPTLLPIPPQTSSPASSSTSSLTAPSLPRASSNSKSIKTSRSTSALSPGSSSKRPKTSPAGSPSNSQVWGSGLDDAIHPSGTQTLSRRRSFKTPLSPPPNFPLPPVPITPPAHSQSSGRPRGSKPKSKSVKRPSTAPSASPSVWPKQPPSSPPPPQPLHASMMGRSPYSPPQLNIVDATPTTAVSNTSVALTAMAARVELIRANFLSLSDSSSPSSGESGDESLRSITRRKTPGSNDEMSRSNTVKKGEKNKVRARLSDSNLSLVPSISSSWDESDRNSGRDTFGPARDSSDLEAYRSLLNNIHELEDGRRTSTASSLSPVAPPPSSSALPSPPLPPDRRTPRSSPLPTPTASGFSLPKKKRSKPVLKLQLGNPFVLGGTNAAPSDPDVSAPPTLDANTPLANGGGNTTSPGGTSRIAAHAPTLPLATPPISMLSRFSISSEYFTPETEGLPGMGTPGTAGARGMGGEGGYFDNVVYQTTSLVQTPSAALTNQSAKPSTSLPPPPRNAALTASTSISIMSLSQGSGATSTDLGSDREPTSQLTLEVTEAGKANLTSAALNGSSGNGPNFGSVGVAPPSQPQHATHLASSATALPLSSRHNPALATSSAGKPAGAAVAHSIVSMDGSNLTESDVVAGIVPFNSDALGTAKGDMETAVLANTNNGDVSLTTTQTPPKNLDQDGKEAAAGDRVPSFDIEPIDRRRGVAESETMRSASQTLLSGSGKGPGNHAGKKYAEASPNSSRLGPAFSTTTPSLLASPSPAPTTGGPTIFPSRDSATRQPGSGSHDNDHNLDGKLQPELFLSESPLALHSSSSLTPTTNTPATTVEATVSRQDEDTAPPGSDHSHHHAQEQSSSLATPVLSSLSSSPSSLTPVASHAASLTETAADTSTPTPISPPTSRPMMLSLSQQSNRSEPPNSLQASYTSSPGSITSSLYMARSATNNTTSTTKSTSSYSSHSPSHSTSRSRPSSHASSSAYSAAGAIVTTARRQHFGGLATPLTPSFAVGTPTTMNMPTPKPGATGFVITPLTKPVDLSKRSARAKVPPIFYFYESDGSDSEAESGSDDEEELTPAQIEARERRRGRSKGTPRRLAYTKPRRKTGKLQTAQGVMMGAPVPVSGPSRAVHPAARVAAAASGDSPRSSMWTHTRNTSTASGASVAVHRSNLDGIVMPKPASAYPAHKRTTSNVSSGTGAPPVAFHRGNLEGIVMPKPASVGSRRSTSSVQSGDPQARLSSSSGGKPSVSAERPVRNDNEAKASSEYIAVQSPTPPPSSYSAPATESRLRGLFKRKSKAGLSTPEIKDAKRDVPPVPTDPSLAFPAITTSEQITPPSPAATQTSNSTSGTQSLLGSSVGGAGSAGMRPSITADSMRSSTSASGSLLSSRKSNVSEGPSEGVAHPPASPLPVPSSPIPPSPNAHAGANGASLAPPSTSPERSRERTKSGSRFAAAASLISKVTKPKRGKNQPPPLPSTLPSHPTEPELPPLPPQAHVQGSPALPRSPVPRANMNGDARSPTQRESGADFKPSRTDVKYSEMLFDS